jgi:hypothetical protein
LSNLLAARRGVPAFRSIHWEGVMSRTIRNAPLLWFRRVLWLGIVANVALAGPTLLVPERMLAISSLPPATPLMWPRFAAWLLILLSAFYVPAALDPTRYRTVAWLAVGARLMGVLFFLTQSPAYRALGAVDLVFFLPEAILLWLAARRELRAEPARIAGAAAAR